MNKKGRLSLMRIKAHIVYHLVDMSERFHILPERPPSQQRDCNNTQFGSELCQFIFEGGHVCIKGVT